MIIKKNSPSKNAFNVKLDLVNPSCEAEARPPRSKWLLSETVPLTVIATVNVKVTKYLYICGIPSPHLTLQCMCHT